MSAPKASESAAIPRIVLDDRDGEPDHSNNSNNTTTTTTNGPGVGVRPLSVIGGRGPGGGGRGGDDDSPPGHYGYVPHRCNSDIGLPTASMPNLSMALNLGENGTGDKLGVYCSPRTTRRSVDLDLGSRDPGGYEWLEEKTSSLRVLSAGSRVGSAVSLNSVCTAHSVGLLSNDSDDDYQDTSLHDGSVSGSLPQSERAGQLRRLQSYPEDDKGVSMGGGGVGGGGGGDVAGVTPRTSHSLSNLKAAQAPSDIQGRGREQLTPEKLCLLPSELDESDSRVPPGGRREEGGGRQRVSGGGGGGGKAEDGKKAHIVSYDGKGSASMREGRIRRWLEDMDKATE